MGTRDIFIERLAKGKVVEFKACGHSMTGKINHGEKITVSPDVSSLSSGDMVFCRVKGFQFVHLVTAVRGSQYQISNNRGKVNGWIGLNSIYGKVIGVQP